MILKPFSMLLFVMVMIWIGSIMITTDPMTRVGRACEPVNQAGVFSTSIAALASPGMPPVVKAWFDERTYECRFAVWRQFYEAEYMQDSEHIKALQEQIEQLKAKLH